jgi:hypothetical protein
MSNNIYSNTISTGICAHHVADITIEHDKHSTGQRVVRIIIKGRDGNDLEITAFNADNATQINI